MANNNYIPSRDSDFNDFYNNFKTLIAANPTNYGLVVGDGTALTSGYAAWSAAYLAANNPTTRTKATVATKNQQKAVALTLIRGYAATIRANHAVSDALKIGLGLHIPSSAHTPVPAPSTYPLLTIESFNLGKLQLKASDQSTPDSRSRPAGVSGMLLFSHIGTTAITDPTGLDFNAFLTKTKYENTFTSADNGKTITYFARWTNGKGELGPWSPPVSIRIAA